MELLDMHLEGLEEKGVRMEFKDHEELARTFAVLYHLKNWLETKDSKHIGLIRKSISIDFPIEEVKSVPRTSLNSTERQSTDIFEFYKKENEKPKKILF